MILHDRDNIVTAYCVEENAIVYACFRWEWLAKTYIHLKRLKNARIRKVKVLKHLLRWW